MSGSVSLSNQISSGGEQSEIGTGIVADATVNEGAPIGFFAVGLAVNLILIAAFFVWAMGQWKKSGKRDDS